MENDILDSLEDLGYKGPLLEDGALDLAVNAGATSPEFTKLCAWIVSELKLYCKLEENVPLKLRGSSWRLAACLQRCPAHTLF
ncbi:hypothetical protein JZ751_011271 [Albula glossodonta]|uniref:Uncharacterized protein n=1 Tax=Albula glossodonta TaxID=121402 RepID=A0A8T2NWP7_9TELE|nr:hypothetical protein JZ751_011271 [Albula glossodonta]